jgi:hypothetical protein
MKGIKMTLYHHLADYGHCISLVSITMTMTLFRQMAEYRHLRYQIPTKATFHLHHNHSKINLSQPGKTMMLYGKVVAIDIHLIFL